MWTTCRFMSKTMPVAFNYIKTNTHLLNSSRCCVTRFVSTTPTFWERRYSDKHEWVELSGKVGTVGITHYAQEALGDVVYAQLPDVGSSVIRNDECGALESVKAASEVYSPVSGKIVEKNNSVEDTPALVNQSCYEKGWLFKVEISNGDELKELMSEEQYKEFLKTDQH